MTRSGDFNVTAAGGLVLGGIAALLLATAVALGGYGSARGRATPGGAAAAELSATGAGGAPDDAEVELLETGQATPTPAGRTP